ncbi:MULTISPECIES: hypothetical protein [Streptomyces]|uniref:hypothetical protein n=1 Tax=Streptomyces TaxID=1883 RepID=UPI00167150A1|nr:hypothetical protein [Streptomyces ruber]
MNSTDHLLALIRDIPDVADLLHSSFEFGIFRNEHGEAVRAASGASLEPIAGDWAGGTFFLCHDEDGRRPVIYASSEGQGGLIADDLKQALEIITGLAVWQDCLKFSGSGRLEAMEAAAVLLEKDRVSDEPAIVDHRAQVAAALSLDQMPMSELVARLRSAVMRTEPDHLVVTESGDEYESLFGEFVPTDNPGWR